MAARKLLCILAVVSFLSCTSYKDLENERARRAETAKGDILAAVVLNTPFRDTLLDEGIEMAVTEINARGGILGRKLRMEMHPRIAFADRLQSASFSVADHRPPARLDLHRHDSEIFEPREDECSAMAVQVAQSLARDGGGRAWS